MIKRLSMLAALAALCLCLGGCSPAPDADARDAKLIARFAELGMSCAFDDSAVIEKPAIYDASVWRALNVDGETVYVYFDESNRADYLCSQIDQQEYGFASTAGLRYVLNYRGSDEKLLGALRDIDGR